MPARDEPSLSRSPLMRRLLRVLRDLRVAAMLGVLALMPAPAAMGFVKVAPSAAAGDEAAPRRDSRAGGAHVIHVPGIAGPRRIDSRLVEGIVAGGAAVDVEIFDWVGRRRGLTAVFTLEANQRQARRLAERILELKREDGDRPVVLVAHSGGTAVVAWALEMLPELEAGGGDVRVDGVVMLASGLSADYDLSRALGQVAGRVFHLSSTADNLILGAGTLVFGTLDRRHGVAAGKIGFRLPPGVAAPAYANFCEVPYDAAWASLGHAGDHEGMMSVRFGAQVVSDLIRASLGERVTLPTTRPIASAPPATQPATQPAQATH